jgi:hypothetical protein
LNTPSPSYNSDVLLQRLDGLLAELRDLRTQVHELSASDGDDTDGDRDVAATRAKKAKHKGKNTKKAKMAKGKKKANARHD